MTSVVFASSDISDGNLSLTKGDSKQALNSRKKFLKKYDLSLDNLIEISPVHGNQVIIVSDSETKLFETDSVITNNSKISLFLLTADCLPIGIVDSKNHIFSLVHAGRISLEKGIIEKTIKILFSQFKNNPQDLIVKFGPSIGPCCYKWDDINKLPKWKKYFNDGLDIRKFAFDNLVALGISPKNIKLSKFCTYHSNKFYSHRRTVIENLSHDFRFGTIIGFKK